MKQVMGCLWAGGRGRQGDYGIRQFFGMIIAFTVLIIE